MAKLQQVNMRMDAKERDELEAAAQRLGVSVSEAARLAVSAMAKRVSKAGSDGATKETEFIKKQPEFGAYTLAIVSGSMSYDEAVAKCGRQIASRLKSEAAKAKAQADEYEKFSRIFSQYTD